MSIVSAEPSVAAVEEKQRVCAEAETRYREHVVKLQRVLAVAIFAARASTVVGEGRGGRPGQRDVCRRVRSTCAGTPACS